MDRMWAPWRHDYVTSAGQPSGCVLCRALEGAGGGDRLVVHVGSLNFVVMNLFPYNAGHLLVATRRHVGSLNDASPEELTEMMGLARRLEEVLADAYHPEGINLGMNLGRSAGAGGADDVHLHVVPARADHGGPAGRPGGGPRHPAPGTAGVPGGRGRDLPFQGLRGGLGADRELASRSLPAVLALPPVGPDPLRGHGGWAPEIRRWRA